MNRFVSAGVETMPPAAQVTDAENASLTSSAGWPGRSAYPCR